jgi:peptide/nickel transport system substrate-binding protein
MARFWAVFLKVLRSYGIEEKVVSLVLVIIVLIASIQGIVELFKTPGLFVGEGGMYTEGLINDKSTLINPVYVDLPGANREICSLVFSGLTKYDSKLKAFVGDLADLTVSEDKKNYRFVLKDNIYWHDGVKLTADDVYFTYHDVIQNPDFQNPILRVNFQGVEVKEIDEKTIEFVLASPNSFFITNLNVGILPKHVLENVAVVDLPYSNFNLKPVGTGPYKVDSLMEVMNDGRQRVILSASDIYYGEKPKITNVRINVYPNVDSLKKEKNTLNVISKVSKDFYDDIASTQRFSFINYTLPQYTAIFINMESPVLSKYKVRLALQKAIDKDELMKLFTNVTRLDTPLLELKQEDWIYKPNQEEAKGALFDSGYKVNKDSGDPYRKDAKENPLKLVLLARAYDAGTSLAEENKKLTDFLVNAWKIIGVEIDLQAVDVPTFDQRVQDRDYDLLITGQSLGYNMDTYSFWHSSEADGVGLNLSNYKSFAADSLIEKIRGTFDNEKKNSYSKELAKNIAEDIPAIFLYKPSYILATDGKVKGINMDNLAFASDRFAHINEWCINCQ